jgi:hypothetical protein
MKLKACKFADVFVELKWDYLQAVILIKLKISVVIMIATDPCYEQ